MVFWFPRRFYSKCILFIQKNNYWQIINLIKFQHRCAPFKLKLLISFEKLYNFTLHTKLNLNNEKVIIFVSLPQYCTEKSLQLNMLFFHAAALLFLTCSHFVNIWSLENRYLAMHFMARTDPFFILSYFLTHSRSFVRDTYRMTRCDTLTAFSHTFIIDSSQQLSQYQTELL